MASHWSESSIGRAYRMGRTLSLSSLRVLAAKGGQSFRELLITSERETAAATIDPIRSVYLSEICSPNMGTLFLPLQHIRIGASPFGDVVALAALMERYKPARIFEIGTFEGLVSSILVKNAAPDARLFTLDLPHNVDLDRTDRSYEAHSIKIDYDSGKFIPLLGAQPQIERLYGDSAIFDFSPFAQSIDFFFVDGAHTEDYVISDTQRAMSCVRDGGVVAWHDCLLPQITPFLRKAGHVLPLQYIRDTNIVFCEIKHTPEMQRFADSLPRP